ncbi:MAG: hypothetical protein HQL30_06505 [Candidatus Omnitrophica bacterium]|nr:hypothetical protein [Candidatus Omnitrophota bacterium]
MMNVKCGLKMLDMNKGLIPHVPRPTSYVLRFTITLFLTVSLIAPTGTDGESQETGAATLAVMDAASRGVPRAARAKAYRELHEQQRAPEYGGKGAWDLAVEELASKIGYKHPGSVHLTMREVWARFIEENRELVDRGNSMIAKDEEFSATGIISVKTQDALRSIIRNMRLSRELKAFIKAQTAKLKGWLIGRSSGIYEDGFETSLAGVFSSFKKSDERFVVRAVRDVFVDSIGKVWIDQNKREVRLKGVPDTLNEKEGFAVVVQPFLKFESSGTAKTDYYRHISIETVFGDADYAVRSIHANAAEFLFDKRTGEYEFYPSYLSMPYEVRINGEECSMKDKPGRIRELLAGYPRIGPRGETSPLSDDQAREVARVAESLEEWIGVPLDIEWGFFEGELYIIQARPMVREFSEKLIEKDPKAFEDKELAAGTPIALGQTNSGGFTGKMVLFGANVKDEDIKRVEEDESQRGGFIRVQKDIATRVLDTGTKAGVLVDPEQGSRQAHNITLIEDRIHDGEFVYANGPVLKQDLMKKIRFVPHPDIADVWISSLEVTYFSDGLKGSFYTKIKNGVREPVEAIGPMSGNVKRRFMDVKYLQLYLKRNSEGRDTDKAVPEILRDFGKLHRFGPLVEYMRTDGKKDMAKIMGRAVENEDIGRHMVAIDHLCSALNYPLFPNEWDNPLVARLSKVKEFRAEYKRWVVKRSKPAIGKISESPFSSHPLPVNPGKIRVLVMDDDKRKLSDYALRLDKVFAGDPTFEIEYASSWEIASGKVAKKAFDLTFLDYEMPRGTEWTDARIAELIPGFGGIMISSEAYPEWMVEAEEEGAGTLLGLIWPGRDLREEGFPYMDSARDMLPGMIAKIKGTYDALVPGAEAYQGLPKDSIEPRVPDRLTVLFIQDDPKRNDWEGQCREVFTSDEYDFITADSFEKAAELLGTRKIDCCIADIGGTHVDKNYGELRKMFGHGVYGMGLYSGIFLQSGGAMAEDAHREFLEEAGFSADDNIAINPDIIGFVKKARLWQEEDHARMRERWLAAGNKSLEETGAYEAGEGKETVYVIENDPGNAYDLAERIRKERGSKYRVMRMSSMSELSAALGKAVPDIVVTNAFLDDKDELSEIIHAVTIRNPKARFIVASYDAAARSPITGRLDTARRKIEEGHDAYMDRLRKVYNKGWDALSEKTKAVLIDPEKSFWGETLTPESFYEIYTFLNPVHPTEHSMKFYGAHPGLFNERGHSINQKIRSLLYKIVRLGVINSLDRTSAEKDQLKGHEVHGTWESVPDGILETYISALLRDQNECRKFSQEMMIPGEMLGFECGFGDEGDFMPPGYRRDEEAIRRNSMGVIISGARGYLVYGRLNRAINEYRRALIRSLSGADLEKYNRKPSELMLLTRDELVELYRTIDNSLFDPEAVGMILEELLNMKNGWFEEAGFVARELGIRSIIDAVGKEEKNNVIGIVETPFHFGDVIDVLDGVDKEKEIAAGETFKAEEASRICEGMSPGKDDGEPGVINIWSGYARDPKQRELMEEFSRASKGRAYSIRVYDDLDELALEASKDDGTKKVTILPYIHLGRKFGIRKYPENSGVLFMDMPETMGEGLYEFTQIGTIIMTGVAFLKGDEDALNGLYALLTGETHFIRLTMYLLREHPSTVKFHITPSSLNNYNDFTRLNRMMRQILSFA